MWGVGGGAVSGKQHAARHFQTLNILRHTPASRRSSRFTRCASDFSELSSEIVFARRSSERSVVDALVIGSRDCGEGQSTMCSSEVRISRRCHQN